jgi:hypothetical protein
MREQVVQNLALIDDGTVNVRKAHVFSTTLAVYWAEQRLTIVPELSGRRSQSAGTTKSARGLLVWSAARTNAAPTSGPRLRSSGAGEPEHAQNLVACGTTNTDCGNAHQRVALPYYDFRRPVARKADVPEAGPPALATLHALS